MLFPDKPNHHHRALNYFPLMASVEVDWAGAADAQEKALRQMDRLAVGGSEKLVELQDENVTAAERSLLQKVRRTK